MPTGACTSTGWRWFMLGGAAAAAQNTGKSNLPITGVSRMAPSDSTPATPRTLSRNARMSPKVPRFPKLQLIKTQKPPNTGSKKKGPVFAGPFFPKRDDLTGKHCNRSGSYSTFEQSGRLQRPVDHRADVRERRHRFLLGYWLFLVEYFTLPHGVCRRVMTGRRNNCQNVFLWRSISLGLIASRRNPEKFCNVIG